MGSWFNHVGVVQYLFPFYICLKEIFHTSFNKIYVNCVVPEKEACSDTFLGHKMHVEEQEQFLVKFVS